MSEIQENIDKARAAIIEACGSVEEFTSYDLTIWYALDEIEQLTTPPLNKPEE